MSPVFRDVLPDATLTKIIAYYTTPGEKTATVYLDSDGHVTSSDTPVAITSPLHRIDLVYSSTTSGNEGDTITITVDYTSGFIDKIFIDPDGAGVLPEEQYDVNPGDTTKSIDRVFNTAGTFTPEARFESDGIKVEGDPIDIAGTLDPVPAFDIKYNSSSGSTDADETLWNGYSFKTYFTWTDEDSSIAATEVWNPQSSAWEELYNDMVLDFGNGDTAIAKYSPIEDLYFLDFDLSSSGSNRSFDVKGRVKDENGQLSSEDVMAVSVLENLISVVPYDDLGSEVPLTPFAEIYHNMDADWEVEFRTEAQTQATGIAVYEGGSWIENITPGDSYFRDLDFTGGKDFKFIWVKNGLYMDERTITVNSLDHNPSDVEIYEWNGSDWSLTDGDIYLVQGVPLRYRVKLSDNVVVGNPVDQDEDTLEHIHVDSGIWGVLDPTDTIIQNPDDLGNNWYEVRRVTSGKLKTTYTFEDKSRQTVNSSLESALASVVVHIQ